MVVPLNMHWENRRKGTCKSLKIIWELFQVLWRPLSHFQRLCTLKWDRRREERYIDIVLLKKYAYWQGLTSLLRQPWREKWLSEQKVQLGRKYERRLISPKKNEERILDMYITRWKVLPLDIPEECNKKRAMREEGKTFSSLSRIWAISLSSRPDHVSGAFLRRIMLRSAKWVFSRTLFICGEVLTSISTHLYHPWEILKRDNVELHDNQHHRLLRAFAHLPPFPTFSWAGRHLSSGREAFSRNSLISHARHATLIFDSRSLPHAHVFRSAAQSFNPEYSLEPRGNWFEAPFISQQRSPAVSPLLTDFHCTVKTINYFYWMNRVDSPCRLRKKWGKISHKELAFPHSE